MSARNIVIGFGIFFAIVSLVILLIALSTPRWVHIQVSEDLVKTTSVQLSEYTRFRGLFRECFEMADTDEDVRRAIQANSYAVPGSNCLRIDYNTVAGAQHTRDFVTRIALMFTMVALFVLSGVFIIAGIILWSYTLCGDMEFSSQNWASYIKWAGIMFLVAAFCCSFGMAFYHGAEYMELNVIRDGENTIPYNAFFKQSQPGRIDNRTTRFYSYAYAFGWLSVSLSILAGTFLFFAGICCLSRQASEKDFLHKHNTLASNKSYGQRNLAYEFFDPQPQAPQLAISGPGMMAEPGPMYVPEDSYYREHYRGGRMYDPRASKPEYNPTYNYDEGWRWSAN